MVYSHWFPGTLISIFTGFLLDIISIFVVLYIVTRLFNGGFYFGSFFLDTIRRQVSHIRELGRTYTTFIKNSRATPVLLQGLA